MLSNNTLKRFSINLCYLTIDYYGQLVGIGSRSSRIEMGSGKETYGV